MTPVVIMVILLATIFVCEIDFGHTGTYSQVLLRVKNGTGVSFIDLWETHGYRTDDYNVFRNGLIDLPFTDLCPYKLIILLMHSKFWFYWVYFEPFKSNSILDWIMSVPNYTYPVMPVSSFILDVARSEDVILRGYKRHEPRQNLYLAVHFPKSLSTGYPKYFVTNLSEPVLGDIPGDESLFYECEYLQINGRYDDGCNVTHSSQLISAEEMKSLLKERCDNTSTLYKQSDTGYPTIPNATSSWTITASNLIICAMQCSQDKSICKSFFFTQGTGECTGLKHSENAMDKSTNASHYVPVTDTCHQQ